MAQTLYYNELTKQLFIGDCSNGIMECVTLYPTIDSTTFQIDESNQLCVYDPSSKTYQPILDQYENPVNLQGIPGTNGVDGITPQLKIVSDNIYASYDLGVNWTRIGSISGIVGSGAVLVPNIDNYPDTTFTNPLLAAACASKYGMKEGDFTISANTGTVWIWTGTSGGFINGGVIKGADGKDGLSVYAVSNTQLSQLISDLNKLGSLGVVSGLNLGSNLQKWLDGKFSATVESQLELIFGAFFTSNGIRGSIIINGVIYTFQQRGSTNSYITGIQDLNGKDGVDGEDGRGIYLLTDEEIGSDPTDEKSLIWYINDYAGFTTVSNKSDLVNLFKNYSSILEKEKPDFRDGLCKFLSNNNKEGHVIIDSTLFIIDWETEQGAILKYWDINAEPADYTALKTRVQTLEEMPNSAATFITDALIGDGTSPDHLIYQLNDFGFSVINKDDVIDLFEEYLTGAMAPKDMPEMEYALCTFARAHNIKGPIVISGLLYTLDYSKVGIVKILQKDDLYYSLEQRIAALETLLMPV